MVSYNNKAEKDPVSCLTAEKEEPATSLVSCKDGLTGAGRRRRREEDRKRRKERRREEGLKQLQSG